MPKFRQERDTSHRFEGLAIPTTPTRQVTGIKSRESLISSALYINFRPGDLLYGLTGATSAGVKTVEDISAFSRSDFIDLLASQHEPSLITIDKINDYICSLSEYSDQKHFIPPRENDSCTWPIQAHSFARFLSCRDFRSLRSSPSPAYLSPTHNFDIFSTKHREEVIPLLCQAGFLWAASKLNTPEQFTIHIMLDGIETNSIVNRNVRSPYTSNITAAELKFLHSIWETVPGIKEVVKLYDRGGVEITEDFGKLWKKWQHAARGAKTINSHPQRPSYLNPDYASSAETDEDSEITLGTPRRYRQMLDNLSEIGDNRSPPYNTNANEKTFDPFDDLTDNEDDDSVRIGVHRGFWANFASFSDNELVSREQGGIEAITIPRPNTLLEEYGEADSTDGNHTQLQSI